MKAAGGLTELRRSLLSLSFKRDNPLSVKHNNSGHLVCSPLRRQLVGTVVLIGLLGFLVARAQGQSVTITNVYQNHYNYGYPIGDQNCPSGYNIPAGQYSNTYHLERGHAIHHQDPANPSDDYWVYWAHFDNSSYGTAEVAIFKSTTECGPYILQTGLYPAYNTDGAGYGFQPGGWQSRDEIIFRDTDQTYNPDGTVNTFASAYLTSASDSENTVKSSSGSTCSYANDSIAIFKMTPDYLGIDSTTNSPTNGANWAFVCDQREAPVMFRQNNMYFLITSQAAGWYPSQGGYGVSSNPLTGWTPDPLNLGNTSTFGGQTSDGFTIQGTQANTYVLTFDHLGGSDSKNPSTSELYDTGEMWLPVLLDSTAGTATLNWYPSWTVDNTTGVLTLPTLTDLAQGAAISSTVSSASSNPLSYAIDGNYTTRWASSSTGSTSFNAAKPATSTLCPVTGATTSTTCNPSLVVDLGTVQPVQEIDLSQYMVKGSEPYYTYKIAYSSDDVNWTILDYTTVASFPDAAAKNISDVPFSNNITYGFNFLPVDFSARFVALIETGAITQNSTSPPYTSFYGPGLYEMGIIESTAPASPQPATVTVTPSTTTPQTDNPLTVAVNVRGPSGQPTPSGYIQLSAPGYISDTYGLVSGANSFTVPAGALTGGHGTITVNYRPDPTSIPIYGIGTIAGTSSVYVSAPDAPTNVILAQNSPGALLVSWTASVGASSYVVNRSSDGGMTYSQIASVSSTSYTDSGLSNGSPTYCYTVAAVNGAGPGSTSAPVCDTATANFPITGLLVSQSGPGALTISFNAIAHATGYSISRSAAGGAFAPLATVSTNSYVDSGLAVNGTAYCYTVAAVFSTGTATASSPACNTASTSFAPTNLQVTPWAAGELYLSWLADDSATSYIVKRSVNGNAYAAVGSAQAALTYIDTGLTNYSTVYCYVVDEVLNGVTSADSVSVCNTATNDFVPVVDYSFEQPIVSLWSTQTSFLNGSGGYGWTFAGNTSNSGNNSGISALSGTFTNANVPPIPLGNQVGVLEGTGIVTQTQPITLTPAQTYTFLVTASQRQTSLQSGGAEPFKIMLNGTNLGTFTPPQSIPYYRDYELGFTAAQASNTLALAGTSLSTTSAVLLDNVRIVTSGAGGFTVAAQPLTVSYGTSSATLTATATFTGSASPASSLIFQVGGGNQIPGACSVAGATLTCSVSYSTAGLAVGAYPINVVFEGDLNYPQSSATATLTVAPASQTITFGAIPTQAPGMQLTLTAAASSGLPVSYTSTTASVCTVSGSTATLLQAGICSITASQAGNTNYSAATPVTQSFAVVLAPTVTMTTTAMLSKISGSYQATVTITNTGSATAANVQIVSATLGSATATTLPVSLGSIAGNGGSAMMVLTFPSSAGADGTGVIERYSGTYTGGTFSAGIRAALP